MDSFISEYYHTIDAKGRVIIPQKYRESLGETFMISRGLDKCLWIQPKATFDEMMEKMRSIPRNDLKATKLKRLVTASTQEVELDKQGRILIAQPLRKFANLTKDVVLAGMDTYIELWDADTYNAVNDMSEDDIEEITGYLSQIGFNL